jgi:hypothetical protein
MNRLLAAGAALAAFSACVTYDFEPVTPIAVSQTTRAETVAATGAKPNVMLLLDKSGSMMFPIDPACTGTGCRTRIDDLRSAMGPFLAQYGSVARFGLSTFPKGSGLDQCLPPGGVRVDISTSNDVDAELSSHAASIDAIVQQIGSSEAVAGGTPTAGSLDVMGDLASLNDTARKNLVVLLTDGLPNCNAQNPVTVGAGGTCKCTLSPTFDPASCTGSGVQGCLDDAASVQAVRDLAARGIKTAVIGFGSDTNGSNVLDLMAAEGGLPRSCKVDADCGAAGPCNNGICRTRYYQANNGAQLADVLRKVVQTFGTPCEYNLGFTPEPNAKLSVLIDGQAEQEDPTNGWSYDAATSKVLFAGSLCDRAMQTTQLNPMQVEIRVLEVVQ